MDPIADWSLIARAAAKIAVAYLMALPIGWDREREQHAIGVRTFPLVAMASCGYVLIGDSFGAHTADVQSRIIQGLVTGIGFIGAGAILKSQNGSRVPVHGTATAASIWNTGVIGAAVAMGRYEVAILLSLLNLLTLRLLLPLKERLDRNDENTKGETTEGGRDSAR